MGRCLSAFTGINNRVALGLADIGLRNMKATDSRRRYHWSSFCAS